MFTGIIQHVGKLLKYDGKRILIQAPLRRVALGESIAIDGVCLTVSARRKNVFVFDVGAETRRITTLGKRRAGARVNVERSLRVGDALGGHWVSGHVEATGRILAVEKAKLNTWFTVKVPARVRRYLVNKGSIAIDGISLTVASLRGNTMKLMIIPHTLSHTTLGDKKPGDLINVEPDLLAKYVLR